MVTTSPWELHDAVTGDSDRLYGTCRCSNEGGERRTPHLAGLNQCRQANAEAEPTVEGR